MDYNVCYISDPRLLEECSKVPNIGKRVRFERSVSTVGLVRQYCRQKPKYVTVYYMKIIISPTFVPKTLTYRVSVGQFKLRHVRFVELIFIRVVPVFFFK